MNSSRQADNSAIVKQYLRLSSSADWFQDSSSNGSGDLKFETCNLKQRNALIAELVRLRRHYPDAKILGLSEIDLSSAYAPIKVSPWMNQLRREMSDLP